LRIVVLLLPFALTAVLSGQSSDSSSGLIVGQIVDATSGRPLSGAVVSLTGPPTSRGVPQQRILTRPDGRFFFRGLRAGSYGVLATKGGYADGSYGRLRPLGPSLQITLTDGGRFGEAMVRMWKHASISGTVLDEAGEPQIGLAVAAYRRGVHAGRLRYLAGGTATTDDRGMFRISGLVPGTWIVGTSINYRSTMLTEVKDATEQARQGARGADQAVATMQQYGFVSSGDAGILLSPGTILSSADGAAPMVYLPTYHPAATAAEAAAAIALTSGQEYVGADLRITPVRAVPVSGVVIGPEGPLTMTSVRLTSGHEEELIQRNWLTASTDRGGRFSFPAVATGDYRLRVRRGLGGYSVWADLPLSVGIEPIDNLQVEAREGLIVQGRLEFGGSSSTPRTANNVQIVVEPVHPEPGAPATNSSFRTNTAGEFASPRSLPGGQYYVRVPNSPRGWMFLGATVEGRDVTDAPLSLTSGVHNIVVSFTDRWSGIQGSVQSTSGRDGTSLVLVFPTDQDLWGSSAAMARRVRSVRTQRTGEYSLTVPPGDYYVLAVPDESAADWQDPDFMDAASRVAVRVRVGLGERKIQDLRTRSVR
jgi:hypothetical protein